MRDLVTCANFMGLASFLASALGIYLAFMNYKGAAETMAAICLATGLLSKLEYVKSFEDFTIKAQLQDRIDKADELIAQLRELSILVAKAGYGSTGISMLALGGIQSSEILLTKDFDTLLARLKLSKAELLDARRPLLRVVGLKIASNMSNISSSLMNSKSAGDPRSKEFEAPNFAMTAENLEHQIFTIDSPDQLRAVLKKIIPTGPAANQQSSAETYINKMVKIFEDCQDSGGLTPEFLALDKGIITQQGVPEVVEGILSGKTHG